MQPLDELTGDDAIAAAALRALGGLICTGCGAELDRSEGKLRKFRCQHCGQGYCPFCERSTRDGCRHRIARNEDQGSRLVVHVRDFPGVIDEHREMPWLPVKPPFLLAFPEDEQRAAFGTAAELVENLCGATLMYGNTSYALFFGLLRHVAGDGEVVSGSRGKVSDYFFARDPEAARAKAREMLRDLEAGFARLAASPPPLSPFLERVLPLDAPDIPLDAPDMLYDMDGEFGNRAYFCFAPGLIPRLAYAMFDKIVLWRLDRDAPPRRMSLPEGESAIALRFTRDGARLGVRSSFNCEDSDEPIGTTYLWDCETGQLVGRKQYRSDVDYSSMDYSEPNEPPHFAGLLHGGATEMTASGGTIRVTSRVPPQPDEEHPQGGASEIFIRLRGFIAHAAITPDGETFAVIHGAQDGAQILIFRVPPEAVHGPTRTASEEQE